MATSTGAFFAGIGTTFVVLAVGFGGGLILANSALKEPSGYQARAASEALSPVRVILPTSAEAAQPPQQPLQQASLQVEPATQPVSPPAKEGIVAKLEKAEATKSEAEERERKRRYAERKARRQAEARARQHRELQQPRTREDAPIMAFSGDSSPRFGGGLFGN
jgi:hypothetical protein